MTKKEQKDRRHGKKASTMHILQYDLLHIKNAISNKTYQKGPTDVEFPLEFHIYQMISEPLLVYGLQLDPKI